MKFLLNKGSNNTNNYDNRINQIIELKIISKNNIIILKNLMI